MDLKIQTPNEKIREIEDIIDIQKANGSLGARQVAFSLPDERVACAGAARSLESGLGVPRKGKKQRGKRRKSPLPDVVSWPSDSDVTVLRMQCGGGLRDVLAGDGLHRPDASSMVNLATLVLSPSASKHSLARELLLPLSSWERPRTAPSAEQIPSGPVASSLFEGTRKSKLAKFLRLYFCPCCSCLYEMEKNMREQPSLYTTTSRKSQDTRRTQK